MLATVQTFTGSFRSAFLNPPHAFALPWQRRNVVGERRRRSPTAAADGRPDRCAIVIRGFVSEIIFVEEQGTRRVLPRDSCATDAALTRCSRGAHAVPTRYYYLAGPRTVPFMLMGTFHGLLSAAGDLRGTGRHRHRHRHRGSCVRGFLLAGLLGGCVRVRF